jgi:hypothetical protein
VLLVLYFPPRLPLLCGGIVVHHNDLDLIAITLDLISERQGISIAFGKTAITPLRRR